MDKPIIEVRGLGKRYLLGAGGGERYRALRDVLTNGVKNLFRPKSRAAAHQEFWALKGVDFDIRAGERVGIIGRNGAGKSTLLKILSEITEPTEGHAHIRGRVASILEIGTGFHPELTGRENIFMNGAIMGMTRAEINRKFDAIVGFAEIGKFLDTPVKRYSSGMYVRLAFSVAAHLDPEILMVDEVLAVGDIAFQNKCLGKMQNLGGGGRTVLFVSHNMGAIRSLCETAVWVDKGSIVMRGPAKEVVESYMQSQMGTTRDDSRIKGRPTEEVANRPFHIQRAALHDVQCRETDAFRYADSIVLDVWLKGTAKERFSMEFRIYNELGNFIACGASGAYHGIYFDRDTRNIRITIGPLHLTSGRYSIALSLVAGLDGAGVSRIDSWENAACFLIEECKPFPTNWEMPTAREGACVIQQSFSRTE